LPDAISHEMAASRTPDRFSLAPMLAPKRIPAVRTIVQSLSDLHRFQNIINAAI
jgi:hypothetical protein